MKTDESVSISGSEKGIKRIATVLMFLICGYFQLYSAADFSGYTIDGIYFQSHNKIEPALNTRYHLLLRFQKGDRFDYKQIRKSMENLYKTGSFDNIEVNVRENPGLKLDVYLSLTDKYTIDSIKISEVKGFKKSDLINSIYTLRENMYFDENKMPDVIKEMTDYLNSRGYFNPGITYTLVKKQAHSKVFIKLSVQLGLQTTIGAIDLNLDGNRPDLLPEIKKLFDDRFYAPIKYKGKIEKVNQVLKKKGYYLPEITVVENFLDPSKSGVNLKIEVDPGYKYLIKFDGMKGKPEIVSPVWEKKVFEKWAEKESKSRILYYLKNQGYLNATVQTKIVDDNKKLEKTITFFVTKGNKYKLGKVRIRGNKSVSDSKLLKIMQSNDIVFDRYIHARLRTLLVDREMLQLYYYFIGYPSVKIFTKPQFLDGKADVLFTIREGKKYIVDKLLIEGNRFFTHDVLFSRMQTREKGPFVQQKLNEDIERIRSFYISNGFEKIEITPDVSPGTEKLVLIKIKEGKAYRMGDLITIGGSAQQRKLVVRLFPFKKGESFNQAKLEDFQREIENSSIFNRFNIVKIEKDPDLYDVMVKVGADYSAYYGFGIGWEGRKNFRGTLEYQGRNIFRSYSNFSALAQLGLKEISGVLSYDTPYFFKNRISSALKIWGDYEVYPSYKFNRYGIGESLIRKLNPNSYIMGSLSWYRTKLEELEITPSGIDRLKKPFNTTAIDFSYVNELRDDPFNPTQGTFFSTDLKIGLPITQKKYSFFRIRWSYQKNFKIFNGGILTTSMRAGLAYGDMSITERFFSGGFNSFRAAGKDRLGPIDIVTQKPRGGNALLLFNIEATFPISILPVNDIYYTVFFDIGNVFEKVHHFDLTNLRKGLGVSFKYKTQMGPLRLDVAWDLETGKPEIQIGIGNVF